MNCRKGEGLGARGECRENSHLNELESLCLSSLAPSALPCQDRRCLPNAQQLAGLHRRVAGAKWVKHAELRWVPLAS